MTTREKIARVIKNVPERQLETLYSAIVGMVELMKEAEDEVFCLSLAEKGQSEDDGNRYSMEDVLKELNINSNEI